MEMRIKNLRKNLIMGAVIIVSMLAPVFVLSASCSESSANYEISSYIVCAGGESGASPSYDLPRSTIGDIFSDVSETVATELSPGYIPQTEVIAPVVTEETGTIDIEVTGTIDDNDAEVGVNGIEALVADNTFSATITLLEGPNDITVIATDQLSNTAQKKITVYLDTRPPRRPTVNPVGSPTALGTQTLSGTKEAYSSIWINGIETVAIDSSATWSYTVALTSGDNSFLILSKDRAANASTSVSVNVRFDPLAPKVTITSPDDGSYTNYSLINVTGTVDDPNSDVWVNGIKAALVGNNFTANGVVLAHRGSNIITAQAINSGGHTSVARIIVILGRLPTIVSLIPQDGTKFYEGDVIRSQVEALDMDGDSIEYQFILDGKIEQTWSAIPNYDWTTGAGDQGAHTLKVEARDGFGGKSAASSEFYIYVEPIAFPSQ